MPAPPEPNLDVRHWELAEKLRSAPPRPGDELRERVLALAASPPRPVPRRFRAGRLALAVAPLALVAVLIWSAGANLGSPGGDDAGAPAPAAVAGEGVEGDAGRVRDAPREDEAPGAEPYDALGGQSPSGEPFSAPPGRRLQSYHADLRIRVDDVSELGGATQRAMRATHSLGGYVVTAEYGAGREGDSTLVVRVPISRVQDAIARFADLGALVSQQIRIQDLQAGFDRQERRIRSLRRTIARLEARIADAETTPEQRAELRVRLVNARQNLDAALRAREATLRQGRLARLSLTLTTRGAAAAPPAPGYFERTMRDAFTLVGRVVAWMLFALVVASPFLVLLALAWLGERFRRRRADERLLERAPSG